MFLKHTSQSVTYGVYNMYIQKIVTAIFEYFPTIANIFALSVIKNTT